MEYLFECTSYFWNGYTRYYPLEYLLFWIISRRYNEIHCFPRVSISPHPVLKYRCWLMRGKSKNYIWLIKIYSRRSGLEAANWIRSGYSRRYTRNTLSRIVYCFWLVENPFNCLILLLFGIIIQYEFTFKSPCFAYFSPVSTQNDTLKYLYDTIFFNSSFRSWLLTYNILDSTKISHLIFITTVTLSSLLNLP